MAGSVSCASCNLNQDHAEIFVSSCNAVMISVKPTAPKKGARRRRTSNRAQTRDLHSVVELQPRAIGPSCKSFISHCPLYQSYCRYAAIQRLLRTYASRLVLCDVAVVGSAGGKCILLEFQIRTYGEQCRHKFHYHVMFFVGNIHGELLMFRTSGNTCHCKCIPLSSLVSRGFHSTFREFTRSVWYFSVGEYAFKSNKRTFKSLSALMNESELLSWSHKNISTISRVLLEYRASPSRKFTRG